MTQSSENQPAPPAAEWVRVSDLIPWAKNPRHNDKAAKKIAASIQRFGFGSPILARLADRMVIAGHTRLKAVGLLPALWSAREALPPEKRSAWHPDAIALAQPGAVVPVRFLDLTESEAAALALADNKLGEDADWDIPQLTAILQELAAEKTEIKDLGFTDSQLQEMLRPRKSRGDPPETKLQGLRYVVIVDCADEAAQLAAAEALTEGGYQCRLSIL